MFGQTLCFGLPEWLYLATLAVAFMLGALVESSGWLTRCKAILASLWSKQGRCRLVGAGPGDPSLLTLAAKTALEEADIVIADRLVDPATLKLVKGELWMSRKFKGCANKAQDELHEWTLEALRSGKNVVRLKGGDPFLYGRGAEEINVFRKAGFQVEVIPGVSSSLAAPLAAGIAVTTRGVADQLLIATGHGMNDTVPAEVPAYYAGRTTVYLMSVGRMQALMSRLQEPHIGYPKSTPVAVIERATTRSQRVVRGTVDTIASICNAKGVESPATIVIGRAAEALLDSSLDETSQYQFGDGCVRFHPLPSLFNL